MFIRPTFSRPHAASTLVAAASAALIAIGLLTFVTGAFQRDGAPFEQLVVAERACAKEVYVSERESCMRAYLAASRPESVASR